MFLWVPVGVEESVGCMCSFQFTGDCSLSPASPKVNNLAKMLALYKPQRWFLFRLSVLATECMCLWLYFLLSSHSCKRASGLFAVRFDKIMFSTYGSSLAFLTYLYIFKNNCCTIASTFSVLAEKITLPH